MAKDSKSAVPIIRTLSYEGLLIDFTDEAWFNATAVAKRFGKNPADWLRQSDTAEYVAALAKRAGNDGFLTEFNKIKGLKGESAAARTRLMKLVKATGFIKTKAGAPENGGGTWMHPRLGVAFARWLDIDFAIWCDMQIDEILRERILAEDLRVSEYLPTYHSLHRQVSVLAADSPNKRFIHMNINKLLNKTVGVCAGERGKLDLHGRSLMVVAQSVAISALDGAENHHDGYRAVRVRLNNFKKSLVIASFDPESP